jgi:hypothetical protein
LSLNSLSEILEEQLGISINSIPIEEPFLPIEESDFLALFDRLSLKAKQTAQSDAIDCQLIGEPNFVQNATVPSSESVPEPSVGILHRIKSFFHG